MIDKDFWVKWLAGKMEGVPDAVKLIFITDVRFDNEAEWIRKQGGIVIEIIRDGHSTLGSLAELQHESESGITHNLVDYSIINRESVEHLGEQLNKVLMEAGILEGWVDPSKDVSWN